MNLAHDTQHTKALARRTWAAWGLSWALVGCGNPCRELSEKICSCMASFDARQSCNSRIGTLDSQFNADASSPSYISAEQAAAGQTRCAQLLKTCSCAALQQGDLQACGLANEAAGP